MNELEKKIGRVDAAEQFARHLSNVGPEDNPGEGSSTWRMARPWCILNIAYPGLEQSMKVAAEINTGTRERGHDLMQQWRAMDSRCQAGMEFAYREWTGFHIFPSWLDRPESVEGFLESIATGYVGWRYWLTEPEKDQELPALNDLLLMAIWKGLNHEITAYDASEGRYWSPPQPSSVNTWLEHQIEVVFREGQTDEYDAPVCRSPTLNDYAQIIWQHSHNPKGWEAHLPKAASDPRNWTGFFNNIDAVEGMTGDVGADPMQAFLPDWKAWLRRARTTRIEIVDAGNGSRKWQDKTHP